MRKIKFMSLFLSLSLLLMTGCGTSGTSSSFSNSASSNNSAGNSAFGSSLSTSEDESAVKSGTVSSSDSADSSSSDSYDNSDIEASKSDKLVYTCDMSVQTLDYDQTVTSIRQKITDYNGIVASENETDSANDWYYNSYSKSSGTMSLNITVRIPADQYEAFLSGLEGTGRVMSRSENVRNISKTYYDTEATIESLEIQESRLLNMMNEAASIDDMLTIESRLTEVQTELNKNKTQLDTMNTDVNYSTVNISVQEVVEYSDSETVKKTGTFGDRLINTFKDSWKAFLSILEFLLFLIIRLVPIALIALAIIFPVRKLVRYMKAKRKTSCMPNSASKTTDDTVYGPRPGDDNKL